MKRLIFSVLFFVGLGGVAFAGTGDVISITTNPVSNGVKIATGIIILESVAVSSPGSADSRFFLFDSAVSTNNAIKTYSPFSGQNAVVFPFDTTFSSGVFYGVDGTRPPVLHIRWKYKVYPK